MTSKPSELNTAHAFAHHHNQCTLMANIKHTKTVLSADSEDAAVSDDVDTLTAPTAVLHSQKIPKALAGVVTDISKLQRKPAKDTDAHIIEKFKKFLFEPDLDNSDKAEMLYSKLLYFAVPDQSAKHEKGVLFNLCLPEMIKKIEAIKDIERDVNLQFVNDLRDLIARKAWERRQLRDDQLEKGDYVYRQFLVNARIFVRHLDRGGIIRIQNGKALLLNRFDEPLELTDDEIDVLHLRVIMDFIKKVRDKGALLKVFNDRIKPHYEGIGVTAQEINERRDAMMDTILSEKYSVDLILGEAAFGEKKIIFHMRAGIPGTETEKYGPGIFIGEYFLRILCDPNFSREFQAKVLDEIKKNGREDIIEYFRESLLSEVQHAHTRSPGHSYHVEKDGKLNTKEDFYTRILHDKNWRVINSRIIGKILNDEFNKQYPWLEVASIVDETLPPEEEVRMG